MISVDNGKVTIECGDNIGAMSDFVSVIVALITKDAFDWGDIIFCLGQAQDILKRIENGEIEITEEDN